MLECCVLFLHYRDDTTTRAHLEVLRRLNPYPVVAVCRDEPERVAGALDVGCLTREFADEPKWEGCDTILYSWYRHGGLRARRYIALEWDTLATLPVREFYDEVWDADAAGSTVMRIESDDWYWFHQNDLLPEAVRPRACGIVPFNGLLLSDRAMAAVATGPVPPRVFAELRVGSLVRGAGFEPVAFPPHKARTNSYDPAMITTDRDRPGLYHPVKSGPPALLDPLSK